MRVKLIKIAQMMGILVAIIMLMVAGNSYATIMIDDFSVTQYKILYSANSSWFESVSGPITSVIGNERDSYLHQVANKNALILNIDGTLNFNQGGGVIGYAQFQWDGTDNNNTLNTTGLGGIDLTESNKNNAIAMRIIAFDYGSANNIDLTVTIYDMNGQSSALTLTLTSLVNQPFNYNFLFTDFLSKNTIIDLSRIGAITLDINYGLQLADTELEIDFLKATYVPEPGTLMLLGSGLIGLAGYGRLRFGRRKKKA